MSRHMKVDGKLLQMNKTFGQLKQKQREKIINWMYEAYKVQVSKRLSDSEALQMVYDHIEESGIWIPWSQIERKYRSHKSRLQKRLDRENVPQRVFQMQALLRQAEQRMAVLEKQIQEYQQFQGQLAKLEEYYESDQWEIDSLAEKIPAEFTTCVLSADKVEEVLSRNQKLLERIQGTKKALESKNLPSATPEVKI